MTVISLPTRSEEEILWTRGHVHVAGIDEVGRGCLAGPLTVAAVVLPVACELTAVQDSKRLTSKQRLEAAAQVKRCALAVGIGWVSSGEVDELGLTAAQQRAAQRALAQIGLPDAIILDGTHNYLGGAVPVQMVPKGDQTCLAVAAASVVAKVSRDRYMELLHRQLPDYGFAKHKGYGSQEHLQALQRLGASVYHRRSYQPVSNLACVG